MKFILKQINALFPFLYPSRHLFSINYFRGIYGFFRDLLIYKKCETKEFPLKFKKIWPFYFDKFDEAGKYEKHYFYQDLWAAKKIFKNNIKHHYDIGSRLDGFISHCLVFTKITMIDIRPLDISINNLEFINSDATNMKDISDNSIVSLSSLHAIEHFGLGRYGDPINANGYKQAINEMQRVVLGGGGYIFFAVPVGKQRVEFNGHRIFSPNYVIDLFDKCKLIEFSVEDDNGNFIENTDPEKYLNQTYACGMYWFEKQ